MRPRQPLVLEIDTKGILSQKDVLFEVLSFVGKTFYSGNVKHAFFPKKKGTRKKTLHITLAVVRFLHIDLPCPPTIKGGGVLF